MLFRPPVRHEVLGLDVGTLIRGSMKRREFIRLVGGSVAAWPLVARAQQPAMPVIGFLHSGSLEPFAARIAAFHQGLGQAGFCGGRHVDMRYRWLPAL